MLGLIFTYLLSYGGALVALFQPFWGLLCFICLALLPPHAIWYWSVPEGNYSRILGGAIMLGWIVRRFGNWRLRGAAGIVIAATAYVGWIALSSLDAIHRRAAQYDLDLIGKTVLIVAVGITLIDSVGKLKAVVWTLVFCHAYPAYELNLTYLRGYNRLYFEGYAYFDNNSYAVSLVTAIPLVFFLALHVRQLWLRVVLFGVTGLILHTVLISLSRGGMLGLIVVLALSLWFLPRNRSALAVYAVLVLLAVRLAGPQVRERFSTVFLPEEKRDGSAASRLELWGNCLTEMSKHPWLGVGPGNFQVVASQYGWRPGKQAHSLWLQAGAELGVPGLLFLLAFYGICWARLVVRIRGDLPPDPALLWLARAVVVSLAGFVVSAQFVSLYRLEMPYYVVLLGAGVLKLWPHESPVTVGPGVPVPRPAT